TWPAKRIKAQRFFLNGEGLGARKGRDTPKLTVSPQTLGLAGGEWCPYGTGGEGPEFPGDQRYDDGASLCFDSAPLKQTTEILDAAQVVLDLSVDKPTAFVCVRLNDVKPDGSVARAAYAVLNLTHRDGHDKVKQLVPGKRYKVKVRLSDTAYSFGKDHRLRVAVSTSYWPMIWPSPEPVALTLHTGTSTLDLPVRPLRGGPKLRAFEPAEEAAPMAVKQLTQAPGPQHRDTRCADRPGRGLVGTWQWRLPDRGSRHGVRPQHDRAHGDYRRRPALGRNRSDTDQSHETR
ncbi:MAG: CocE/NonD family hydrolase C-terminal non-catalytic domain-containing protein, partial [Alphaproteobacteria bacterium]|nr:CocE/NonD family hydrolase C-terminal non-catalytic domain-containing protein [Alphaproteobacteria bacterium]